ncbi:unnamed protein product [Schistosoma margrebowiei]|uniref:Uncharacterized protein n=1 Tax=Schistosoma margrebowiei TaxID=48269 RepID=A0A183MTQ1_9TREM|nr:unnamed protein product [Schistosoma margrebowiei]
MRNVIPGLLKPRSKPHVRAFNVRTLYQIGQQASLARTSESRAIDVCCVSETRIQDPSSVIHLTSPCQNKEPTRFTLRVSGSPDSASRGLADVGIALSPRAELALLEWIPVDSRLCAVRLNGTVRPLPPVKKRITLKTALKAFGLFCTFTGSGLLGYKLFVALPSYNGPTRDLQNKPIVITQPCCKL